VDEGVFPETIRAIFTAGEQLKLNEQIQAFTSETRCRLLNYYGPSETHVVSWYEVFLDDYMDGILPPIGKPISNTELHILSGDQQLCGIGMVGELCIGGIQLARGYWKRVELTNERFIPNPFSADKGARLYRTGDLARWTLDGNIEFLGRADDQVKIRGNRVEIGEVETTIGMCSIVKQCVVLADEDVLKNKVLTAYVVSDSFDLGFINTFLRSKLPGYMIPSAIIDVPVIPLTRNGKVDRKRLMENKASGPLSTTQYVPPTNEVQLNMSILWQELLGVEQVGINDNFFELGGNSINTIQIVSRLRKLGYQLQVEDVFIHQTIAQLSNVVEEKRDRVESPENNMHTSEKAHDLSVVLDKEDRDSDDSENIMIF
jgi:aryl carrier-like protein